MSLARLQEALGRAATRRPVAVDVAEHVAIPRRARKEERKDKKEVMPWDVEEVQMFVHGIREDRLHAAILPSPIGLRPAEVCGLRRTDVDLGKATVVIAETRTTMGNRYVVEKDTRSPAGERKPQVAGPFDYGPAPTVAPRQAPPGAVTSCDR